MARFNFPRRIDNQVLMFDEIFWWQKKIITELDFPFPDRNVSAKPINVKAGLVSDDEDYTPPEVLHPPFWVYDFRIDPLTGLELSNINVADARSAGSIDEVFEFINFTDLEVEFTDGSKVPFDISSAFQAGVSYLEVAENGTRVSVTPNDDLFQRGIKLSMTQNVLDGFNTMDGTNNICNVTLEMSVVFRGAANDFDPGRIPVAMDLWPQIAFSWNNEEATKFVKRFRGSVRFLLRNKMGRMGIMESMNANVAGLFTDSNESMSDGRHTDDTWRAKLGKYGGLPFGWRMVFDYLTANISQEKEIVGVYGPNDGNKFIQLAHSLRRQRYIWPPAATTTEPLKILLAKRDRQGDYDNTHTHAKMPKDNCDNVPIHAPFCGHSCIHLHWRWASLAVTGAESGHGWPFKGWSGAFAGNSRYSRAVTPQAYSTNGAPLIPPNQRLMYAICNPTRTRFSNDHIINPAQLGNLDELRKLNWYSVDILNPTANQKQVIFEQGMGWAYRYAVPDEAETIEDLNDGFLDDLPWTGTPTQLQMMQFFDHVYEVFRYFQTDVAGNCVNQVPDGTHNGGTAPSMEDL